MTISRSPARSIADLDAGIILATVDIAAPPERVFHSLTDPEELAAWWGSPETYQTEYWNADFRVGGKWVAGGHGSDGTPYSVSGEYLEIDPPRRLVMTWAHDWERGAEYKTTVAFTLDVIEGGTRLTLRHSGFEGRQEQCRSHGEGWKMVLDWLRDYVEQGHYFHCRLISPRADFGRTSGEERALLAKHVAYWKALCRQGTAVLFAPIDDPAGPWELVILRASSAESAAELQRHDPAMLANVGFRYETIPITRAILGAPSEPAP